jgi:hypothetical protein
MEEGVGDEAGGILGRGSAARLLGCRSIDGGRAGTCSSLRRVCFQKGQTSCDEQDGPSTRARSLIRNRLTKDYAVVVRALVGSCKGVETATLRHCHT